MTSQDPDRRPSELGFELPGRSNALEAARAGRFRFDVGEIVGEAWSLVPGSKGVLLAGAAMTLLLSSVANGLSETLEDAESASASLLAFTISALTSFATYTIQAGMFLFAIKRATRDSSASYEDLFACFPLFWRIAGLNVLQIVMVLVGLMLFVLPGLYLLVAYLMALPLLVIHGLGVWEALETSREALTHCWFRIFGMTLVVFLVLAIAGALTLGIAWIWLVPFATLCYGVAYREIFGFDGVRTS